MRMNLTDLAIQRLAFEKQTKVMDTQLPGFGLVVGKHTKTFIVVKGVERRLQTIGRYPEKTLKSAREEARRILSDSTQPTSSLTYTDAIQRFERVRKGHVKEKTLSRYMYYLNTLKLSGRMTDLTRKDCMNALDVFDGKKRAQNACFSALRTFINWCVEESIIPRPILYRTKPPNTTPSRTRVLTDKELVKVWNAADYKPYGYLIRLLILTGARREEVHHLVDEGDTITFKDTKNKTDHSLPVTPLIREHIMGEYTFNNWQREKERFDEKCGVSNWRLHDLRRTWATNAIKCGVSSDVVERVLNHKQGGIKAVYQRWQYLPEIHTALLTHEDFLRKLLTA